MWCLLMIWRFYREHMMHIAHFCVSINKQTRNKCAFLVRNISTHFTSPRKACVVCLVHIVPALSFGSMATKVRHLTKPYPSTCFVLLTWAHFGEGEHDRYDALTWFVRSGIILRDAANTFRCAQLVPNRIENSSDQAHTNSHTHPNKSNWKTPLVCIAFHAENPSYFYALPHGDRQLLADQIDLVSSSYTFICKRAHKAHQTHISYMR